MSAHSVSEILKRHPVQGLGFGVGTLYANISFELSTPSNEDAITLANAMLQKFKDAGIECGGCLTVSVSFDTHNKTRGYVKLPLAVTFSGERPRVDIKMRLPANPEIDVYAQARKKLKVFGATLGPEIWGRHISIVIEPRVPCDRERFMETTQAVLRDLKTPAPV